MSFSKLNLMIPMPHYDQAENLLTRLAAGCSSEIGFGSMTSLIYDIAWLFMLQKPGSTSEQQTANGEWLFLACFEYILNY